MGDASGAHTTMRVLYAALSPLLAATSVVL